MWPSSSFGARGMAHYKWLNKPEQRAYYTYLRELQIRHRAAMKNPEADHCGHVPCCCVTCSEHRAPYEFRG